MKHMWGSDEKLLEFDENSEKLTNTEVRISRD